jgi:FixJ family two-component response regulator
LTGLEFLQTFDGNQFPCAMVMLTGVGDEALAVAACKRVRTDTSPKTD